MAVHDIGGQARYRRRNGLCRSDVAETKTAAHGDTACAERQMRREFGKNAIGIVAAGQ